MEYYKEIIEVFKVLKKNHLPPSHFITNLGYKLVEETPEPSIEMIELVTYTTLEDYKKRELFNRIDTSGYDKFIAAGIYYCFIHNFIFNNIKSLQSNLSLPDWMGLVANDAKEWDPIKNDCKTFEQYSEQAFKIRFKHVTYDDYEEHRDEMSTGRWPDMKSQKAQKIISAFRAKLQVSGERWEPLFKWLSE